MHPSKAQYFVNIYTKEINKYIIYLHVYEHMKSSEDSYIKILFDNPINDLSTEKIVCNFISYVSSITSVSKKAILYSYIKYLYEIYIVNELEYKKNEYDNIRPISKECKNKIQNIFSHLPKYKQPIEHNICNGSDKNPNRYIIAMLNDINPQFTGMIIENIIANNENIKQYAHQIALSPNSLLNKKELKSCFDNLKSKHKQLLYDSLLHFAKYDLDIDMFVTINKFDKYFTKHEKDINKLIKDIKNATIIRNLYTESNLEHGLSRSTNELHGECDFISDTFITDIKVCKSEEKEDLDKWFYQLYMYKQLFEKPNHKLRIINFYSCKYYEFTIV